MAEKVTIARPYAQAIFELAREQNALANWSEMLQLAAAVVADAEMAKLIESPRVEKSRVIDLIVDICGDHLDATGRNMLRVLAESKRIALLPEIAALYEIERATAEGTIEAEVVSARALTDAQQQALRDSLKRRLGREVSLVCRVDETLIGGAIVRAGDLVIDGSAVGKLNQLGSALLH